jgi:cytochrome c-type biogenesis protein CcmH
VTFWLFALPLAGAVAWFLIRPLLGATVNAAERGAHAIEVYRDQLDEIDRDLERGLVTAEQAAAARIEIERRILAANSGPGANPDPAPGPSAGPAWLAPLAIGVLVPVGAVAVYLALGSPELPSQPFATREDGNQAVAQAHEFETMVARLAERMTRTPDNIEGWLMLGRSYSYLDRHKDAAESYRRAISLGHSDPETAAALGEALVLANDGIVTPSARAAIETALRARPDDVRARYYLALAMEQAGQTRDALNHYVDIARSSPPQAPWLPSIRIRIDALARMLGLDRQQVLAESDRAAPGGFVAPPAGAEAIANLPPGEVEAFMRQRIEALAERLRGEPDDVEGWLRLARSYRVLGEIPKARDAIMAAGRAAEKGGPDLRARVQETARELGLGAPAAPGTRTPPGD